MTLNENNSSLSNKIIYYKLNSPYKEDETKNCGLVGAEIDQNFFNLKEMHIINATWDESVNEIVLTRVDGQEIRVKGLYNTIENDYKTFDFTYDSLNGVFVVTTPVETFNITGFFTEDKVIISNDETLAGDGSILKPLGLSPVVHTGTFRPVIRVIETIDGESVEETLNKLNPLKGDRYITAEKITSFGELYDYHGIEKIINDLSEDASEWRVPTKEDWDVMLSCVEECVCEGSDIVWHDSPEVNVILGKAAGQRLKSLDNWEITYEGDYTTEGTDKFDFSVIPVGYDIEGNDSTEGYGERTLFWTSTLVDGKENRYVKGFDYETNKVFQGDAPSSARLSLRLVKPYNGHNFNRFEVINGTLYPCVLITVPKHMRTDEINSVEKGDDVVLYPTIWTQVNVDFNNPEYLSYPGVTNDEWASKNKTLTHHFINHWDGERWFKHEIKHGDSVVIIDKYKGVDLHEWRVLTDEEGNTHLIDTAILTGNNYIGKEGKGVSLTITQGDGLDKTSDVWADIKGFYTTQEKPNDTDFSLLRMTEDGYLFATNATDAMKHIDENGSAHVLKSYVNELKSGLDDINVGHDLLKDRVVILEHANIEKDTEITQIKDNISKIEGTIDKLSNSLTRIETTLETLLSGRNYEFMSLIKQDIINPSVFVDDTTDPTIEVIVEEGEKVLIKTREDAVYQGYTIE
jgi:uncharacterized protein (TIGR02145 family)